MKRGFSLVELIIVVAVIGILAAMVIPQVQNYTTQAKEAAAKQNLKILRGAVERYTSDHNGIPPGYINGSFSNNVYMLNAQLLHCTNINGDTILKKTKSGPYIYGPYLKDLPENPFNGSVVFRIIEDAVPMPASASGSEGWLYKPSTKEMRLNKSGPDSAGVEYFGY